MASRMIVGMGTNGQVCVQVGTVNSVGGSAHIILDVAGYLLRKRRIETIVAPGCNSARFVPQVPAGNSPCSRACQ